MVPLSAERDGGRAASVRRGAPGDSIAGAGILGAAPPGGRPDRPAWRGIAPPCRPAADLAATVAGVWYGLTASLRDRPLALLLWRWL